MNTKFVFLLLVISTLMPTFDASAEDISCSSSKECYDPCEEETGCSSAKCVGGWCKCYGCRG
uniref:Toxin La-alphaKTx2 n=1 Tax=Liocheles australasiae TaxID=431266 RepID=KAX62_LIOAU